MGSRLLVFPLSLLLSAKTWSIPCYYTLAKDSCWTNYNVTVNVIDDASSTTVLTLSIPKGQTWARGSFECKPAQGLRYVAQFTPVFWQSDVGKTYVSTRTWYMPGKVNTGDKAWTIPICYPADFAQVPLPPTADSSCKCDFTNIPEPTL
ncbi:hypothetical protein [Legionella waltersii]|uniref:Periplasmic protein n=1 Tax=Legionella waltersii TaxID=66969 RepID=A0A0W1ANE2_9GAMM|nr:hypothetical protein [Legionella waltersii]KTD82868.1 periplasmic protein [Legionella waltersii]SNV01948.1 periplasmic protein [Legionella waltersii]